jgi:tetratricopeptide (TPR) repeat protein
MAGHSPRSDAARALAVYDHTLADLDSVPSRFLRLRAINLLAGSSYALRTLGRAAEARRRLDRAFDLLKELNLYPAERIEIGGEAHRALAALADSEADSGDIAAAIARYQDLLRRTAAGAARSDVSLTTAVELSNVYRSLIALHYRHGQLEDAAAVNARRLQLWHIWSEKLPNNAFVRRQLDSPR